MRLVLVMALAAVMLSGCVVGMTPIFGSIFTDVEAPFAVGSASGYSKVGVAEGKGVLGIAFGDVSISTAMRNGNIKKIHHVDYHTENVLGVYSKVTVKVYGE